MNATKTSLIATAIALSLGASLAHANDRDDMKDKDHAAHNAEWKNDDARPERTAAQATTDAAITASVKTRLLADERTQGFDINVDTYAGVVTLKGGADSQADKQAATEVAQRADNVVRVDNQLVVAAEGTERRTQANTATMSGEVRESLDVDDADTRADTDGRVMGDADADVDADVDMDHPDAWLTTKVKTQFLADDQVKGLDINVDTQDKVVTLTGTAPSLAARNKAVEIAQGTEGVRSVVATGLTVDAATE